MKNSFEEATRLSPPAIFLDELDVFHTRVGQSGCGRNDSYDVKAITALLETLDGVAGRDGVVVMGAYSNIEQLDPAIRTFRYDPADPDAVIAGSRAKSSASISGTTQTTSM